LPQITLMNADKSQGLGLLPRERKVSYASYKAKMDSIGANQR